MILPFGGLILGAIIGALLVRRQGGRRLDLAQWAAVCAIIGAIAGLFLLILVSRMAA